jgi:hypothetical protein
VRVRQALWWLVRAVLYYAAFEALAPFAIMLGGGWPRVGEGAAFAVVAASFHPLLRRRLAARQAPSE